MARPAGAVGRLRPILIRLPPKSLLQRLIVYLATLLFALSLLWLVVTAVLVRGEVNAVKRALPSLRADISAGRIDDAKLAAGQLAEHAHRAHELTSGPVWWVSAGIPWVGDPTKVTRVLATQADVLGREVIPGVLNLGDDLHDGSLRKGNQINLSPLLAAEPTLTRSAATATSATNVVADLPHHTWLGSVDAARSTFQTDLTKVGTQLNNAANAVRILPHMLGSAGTRRYFIGFENEAEARGLGGLPGAFAILTVDNGKLSFTHFGSDTELHNVRAPIDFGPDFTALYGQDDPTGLYQNSDISPNFPYAAQIWAGLWQRESGEHVDGAIAIDPSALSYLLAVTGPATTASGQAIGSSEIVALTEQKVYDQYTDNDARKAYLVTVARAVADRLFAGGDTTGLLTAAGRAATERRLVIWTSDTSAQAVLEGADYGGVVDGKNGPYAGFVVDNAAGTKLDHYLDRSMSYQRTRCDSTSAAVATFTMHNDSPASGLPTYVTSRSDSAAAGSKPGDNRVLVTYFGTAGSTITSATLDGKQVPVFEGHEKGLTTVRADVELPVGSTRVLAFGIQEPETSRPLQLLKQPLVRSLGVSVTGATCR